MRRAQNSWDMVLDTDGFVPEVEAPEVEISSKPARLIHLRFRNFAHRELVESRARNVVERAVNRWLHGK